MRFNPFALARRSRNSLVRSAASTRLVSSRPRQQALRIESLEQRALLAIDTASLAGSFSALDTSQDGYVTAVDALLIINELNRTGGGPLAPAASSAAGANGLAAASTPTHNPLDVDGDGYLSATDAILVINKLNADAAADADDLIQIRLAVTDMAGNPITQIAAGGNFKLQGFVLDLRPSNNEGVFAAFADITYESSLASANGAIDHGIYATGVSGTASAGLFDEIGGVTGQFSPPLGPSERLLFSVPMVAGGTPGTIHFVADPADLVSPVNPTHNSLLFNDPDHTIGGVPTSMIAYGSVNLEVLAGPSLSIATPVAIAEGNGGTTQLAFAVTLAEAASETITVNYTTQPLTAAAGADYVSKSGTLTFTPGQTSQNILIDILGDTLDEANETFQVVLSGASGAGITVNTAIGTITDDDPSPVVSITSPAATTETDGSSVLNFVVSLSTASGQPVTVQYTTVTGSAQPGSDYTETSGTVTFAPGETSKNIAITILGDTTDEPTETFQVQLSAPTAATLGNALATGTINDNDPPPTIVVSSPNVTEPSSSTASLTFQIGLSKPSGQSITISYQTTGVTATSGTDYQAISPTQVTFAPGETTKTVTVLVNSDSDIESDETLTLDVTSIGTPSLPAAQGTGTIRDFALGDNQLRIRLVATDLLGNTITQAIATQPFLITAYVEDLRGGADLHGVFQAYLDVLYNSGLISATGPISYGADFPNALSGSTATAGVIDEVGATGSPGFPANPSGEKKLFSVQVVGIAPGTANFELNPADVVPTHDILMYGGSGAVPSDQVLYVNTSVVIAPAPTLSIAPVTVTEGNAGSTTASFVVTLANSLNQPVSVTYQTQPGTGTAGVDYESIAPTVLTFAPGETSKTITVNVLGDTLDETNETFSVVLSNPSGAAITIGTATGTITDDDPAPTVSIASPAAVTETDGNSVLNFVVSLSGASGQTVTVQYTTLPGSALAGSDYTAASGTLTFAPGETSKTIPITIVGDTLDEPTETFQVQISAPTLATLGTDLATGTINDNDPLPALSVTSPSVTEPAVGTTNLTFEIKLSKPSGQPITVSYQTNAGTATSGVDYQAVPPTQVTFAPGETSKTVSVLVNNDDVVEENETLTLNVTSVGSPALPAAQGVGTIRDLVLGDKQIRIRLVATDLGGNPISQVIASQPFLISAFVEDLRGGADLRGVFQSYLDVLYSSSLVSVVGPITYGSDFPNAQSGSAATPGVIDEIGAAGVETFPANPSGEKKLFSVQVVGIAGGTATFAADKADLAPTHDILLYGGSGAVPNDDVLYVDTSILIAPAPTLSIGPTSVTEGNAGTTPASFLVTLANSLNQTVTVNYTTEPISATAGTDYEPKSGTLTFAPGESSKTITVNVLGDTLDELPETFRVVLSGATGAAITTDTAIGTIVDDDPPPVVSISDPAATTETNGNSVLNFTVALSTASGQTVTVQYSTVAGSAQDGSDFTGSSGTLTFAPGETTKTIPITILGDTLNEADETFQVQISGPTLATLGNATATGTIIDNDPLPIVSVSSPTATEPETGTTALTFTISLSTISAQPITVSYQTTAGTATSGSDYQAIAPTQVTFAPGETSKTVTVLVNSDALVEELETFTLDVTSVGTPEVNAAQGVGTIRDFSLVGKQTRIRLVATDLAGSPITQISATDEFLINAYVEDLRAGEDLHGVFQAYLDITYDKNLIATSGTDPITFGTAFPNARSGSLTAGVMDEIGAAGTPDFPANPGDPMKLFSVKVVGLKGGTASFDPNQADSSPLHDILMYGGNGPVPLDNVIFTSTSIVIDPAPEVSIGAASVIEGDNGIKQMSFPVSLSKVGTKSITVSYTTAAQTALAGIDFTAKTGTLTFPAGDQTTQFITIDIAGDLLDENDETFTVNLTGVTGGQLATDLAVGTIIDNDATPTLSVSDATALEGLSKLEFVVTLSAPSGRPVTVNWSTLSGTAIAGVDFGLGTPSSPLTFAPGETSKTVTIDALRDGEIEPTENFTFNLSNAQNAVISDNQAIGLISDIPLSSLAGWAYIDANRTLYRDAGDLALANIPITLTGFNVFDEYVSVPATTDGNGHYQFSGLLPGTYTITESHPNALQDGTDNLGTLGGILLNDEFRDIVVTVGSFGTEYNFGEAGINSAYLTDGNFYASSLNGRR